MKKKEYSVEVNGKTLIAEFSDLTDQANGSVILKYGNTTLLATAVMSKGEKDGYDFFPLTVDYEERFYASGQILGSRYMRREGRPSDEAVLSGRIVDRTIRPLFPQWIRHEVQIVITVLSLGEEDPDVLAVIAASLALGTSDIPWDGPVSAVRIGKIGSDSLLINPTYTTREPGLSLDIVACGKDGNINMIEVGSKQVSESEINDGLKLASEEIEKLQVFQKKVISEVNKEKKVIPKPELSEEIKKLFEKEMENKLHPAVFSGNPGHKEINNLKDEWGALVKEKFPDDSKNLLLALEFYEDKINELLHKEALENEKRPDGRKMDELRPLFAQAGGISPILHGSGIFYRGGTHILSALTLGGPGEAQTVEGMENSEDKKFMHHYNFPPYSSGETGRMGGTNRRMIGHGALAEKALLAVIPSKDKFPYTIRIVSESMASNGSTSMGSVCGGTLALMDAGVPIDAPVAGIASGLMMENEGKYKVLTDIQGPEDHHGDMDFKVAGTRNGVTAIQMDVKVSGVPLKILAEALEKAKSARLRILDVIEKEISTPRPEISSNAPKIVMIKVLPEQIGLVIGPGGKNIKGIKDATGAEIDIEDDGSVFITGKGGGAEKAAKMIEQMTHVYKRGERFEGEVTKILDFGAFVKIAENTEGLVHVSEIANFRVDKVSDYLTVGQKIPVIIKEIDERDRIKLSLKEADPDFIKQK
ncbi:MAG: polyribonucleotide nucleotidyltransferase [Parcubacteria group bacterium]|nr:polyribonucleotide nucleotidyltransferase [Parcubacteria group bacterium]